MSEQKNKSNIDVQQLLYSAQMVNYNQKNEADLKQEKEENFKKRLSEFNNIKTLKEAHELINKIMPVNLERTVFYIGDSKCTIINKHNLLRISFNTKQEFISYNFV